MSSTSARRVRRRWGESLRDTVKTLHAAGADALIVRHPASGAARQIAEWTTAADGTGPSIINAGDGMHEHPTQALRRAHAAAAPRHSRRQTHRDRGRRAAFTRRPGSMPSCCRRWERRWCSSPHRRCCRRCRAVAVTVSTDIDAELAAVDAVMMLRVQAERMNGGFFPSSREYSVRFGLNERRLALMADDAVVLHPGPMLRGMEIGYSVADSPRATVLDQVRNGVHVRMAVLFGLLVGTDPETTTGRTRRARPDRC